MYAIAIVDERETPWWQWMKTLPPVATLAWYTLRMESMVGVGPRQMVGRAAANMQTL